MLSRSLPQLALSAIAVCAADSAKRYDGPYFAPYEVGSLPGQGYTAGEYGNSTTISTWGQDNGKAMIRRIFPASIWSEGFFDGPTGNKTNRQSAWGQNGTLVPTPCGRVWLQPHGDLPVDDTGAPYIVATEQLIFEASTRTLQRLGFHPIYDSGLKWFWINIDPRSIAVNFVFGDKDKYLYQTGNLTYTSSCS